MHTSNTPAGTAYGHQTQICTVYAPIPRPKRSVMVAPTFEGGAFPALALAQEEDLDIRPIPFEFCTFHTDLLIDCVADLLSLLFRENAHFALGG